MISKGVAIALGSVAALLVVGGVAYAYESKATTPAQTPPTDVPITAGHIYQVTVAWTNGTPSTDITSSATGIDAYVQGQLSTLSPNPFTLETATYAVVGGLPTATLVLAATTTTTVSTTTLAFLVGASSPTQSFTVAVVDQSASSSTTVTGSAWVAANAIPSPLGTSITVPVGSSIQVENTADAIWQTPGVTTSNATVVTNSIPATTNGFVAVAPGTATLTGSYVDPTSGSVVTGTVAVTVIAAGTGAISSSGGTSSSSSGSAAATGPTSSSSSSSSTSTSLPPANCVVTGAPDATQWQTVIVLGQSSATVSVWPGDDVLLELPAGATWNSSQTLSGIPTSGSAEVGMTVPAAQSTPFSWTVSWVFAGKVYTTTLSFILGRSWTPATHWTTNDTVRISLTQAQVSAINGAPNMTAEAAAITAALQSNPLPSNATTAQQIDRSVLLILTVGPWGKIFAATSPNNINTWSPPDPVPSDWPSDPSGFVRAEFIYRGPGIDVSALPFGLTSWVRAT